MLFDKTWQKLLSGTAIASGIPNITHLFGPGLSTGANIYLASEPDYASHVKQQWSSHAAPSYIGTIQPATIQDVQHIVRTASSHDIPFLTTGGGHGVSMQMHGLKAGLQVDLSQFNKVEFDAENQSLAVGGSTTFSQLIDPLDKSGAQFPLGTAYCVGVVGATLGAGVSANQGYAGLLSDLLDEVEIVTATGAIVRASRSKNKDLFWAIRGAGANFGIVTSARFKVPDTVNNGDVINANFLFPSGKALELFEYLSSLDDEISEYMALNIAIVLDPNKDQIILLVNVNFAGTVRAAAQYLEPIIQLGPLHHEVLNVRWPDVFSTSYFGIKDTKACSRNQNVNMRSIGAKRTDSQTWGSFLRQLESFSRAYPDVSTSMVVHRFATQRVLDVPSGDSAYPHRELKMHIQLEAVYEDQTKDTIVDDFLNSARHNFTIASGFDDATVYVNFAHGDEGPEAWYGKHNLARLGELKEKWDPQGLFSFYNAIPPIEPSNHDL